MAEMTTKEALEACERIGDLIDDELPEAAWDKASDFFEDIKDKVGDMEETIRRLERVTPAQARALENWEAGIRRWIH